MHPSLFYMKKSNIKKLDKAWSEKVREYGMCEVCHKITPLNAHHFYSRAIRILRWDVENGFCLCVGCHVFSSKFSAHKTPAEFFEWALDRRGEGWYEGLKEKKNSLRKQKDSDVEQILLDISNFTW